MMEKIIEIAKKSAVEAGALIMKVFHDDFIVETKEDKTPVTIADKKASQYIINAFKDIDIPIISEEETIPDFATRKEYKEYLLIDPLDGTKEFINHRTDFTVNIALIKNHYPIFGVVFHPQENALYYGGIGLGAFKAKDNEEEKIKVHHPENELIKILASQSHINERTQKFIDGFENKFQEVQVNRVGSSLKICKIAEGLAHLYPRLGPTMEWDTAAGQAVIEGAGGKIVTFDDQKRLKYNSKESLKNPWFLAKY